MKQVKIIITAEYEYDVSNDDVKEIENIVNNIWLYARSLQLESNYCDSVETEIQLIKNKE